MSQTCFHRSTVLAAAVLALGGAALPALAQTQQYSVVLKGSNESPPNASNGLGVAIVTLDLGLKTMRLQTTFAGLSGLVTAAHIHCCTAVPGSGNIGVATTTPTFTGFPSGSSFGSYDHSFDMSLASSFNASFISANGGTPGSAFSALVAGIDAGRSYLNIHTSVAAGGEIRGFLAPVPEPASQALWLAGVLGLGLALRRRAAAGSTPA